MSEFCKDHTHFTEMRIDIAEIKKDIKFMYQDIQDIKNKKSEVKTDIKWVLTTLVAFAGVIISVYAK